MAVSVDAAAVRAGTTDQEFAAGKRLLAASAVGGLEAGYGGVNADVAEAGTVWQVWVGVVGRTLTGECDCPAAAGPALCRHTAAAALAAVRDGCAWTPLGTDGAEAAEGSPHAVGPGGGEEAADEERYRSLAAQLPAGALVELVVGQALRDARLAAELEHLAAYADD